MAKVIANEAAHISGKLKDVVYVRYYGGVYVRKAPSVRKESRTAAMLQNQQRFARINQFCSPFKDTIIPLIWNLADPNRRGYRLFIKTNSPAFEKDGSIVDPLLLKFSLGMLTMPKGLMAERMSPDADMIHICWQRESHIAGSRLNDELMLVSYDGENFSPMMATGLKRKQLQGDYLLPAMSRHISHIYLFFASPAKVMFSDSLGFKI